MIPFITSMKQAFDLSGKNAIITGGNGGIGLGIAKAMAEMGVNVAIFCRNMEKAENALKELNEIGGKHQVFACDVTKMDTVRKAVAEAYEAYGNFDILVNNSGIGGGGKLLDQDENLANWQATIETDLIGMAHMIHEVGKRMRDGGKGGSIVNITSNAGVIVNKDLDMSAYAAAKAGANRFTKTMAWELGEFDIRVNAIAPGFIHAGFGANPSPVILKLVEAQQPLKRMGEAIEIGALAVYLSSPAAANLTGEVIVIDGGYTLAC
ncbi:MAG: SDR family oxidoreductase [Peptococcaceae bacterium]|jgi:NAD(P)-dependent dehydrogenase (short-subunit alcohol dehydrogenase family)|nr:SDR family oxidoreductase [Peptococcaceae bacterium]